MRRHLSNVDYSPSLFDLSGLKALRSALFCRILARSACFRGVSRAQIVGLGSSATDFYAVHEEKFVWGLVIQLNMIKLMGLHLLHLGGTLIAALMAGGLQICDEVLHLLVADTDKLLLCRGLLGRRPYDRASRSIRAVGRLIEFDHPKFHKRVVFVGHALSLAPCQRLAVGLDNIDPVD